MEGSTEPGALEAVAAAKSEPNPTGCASNEGKMCPTILANTFSRPSNFSRPLRIDDGCGVLAQSACAAAHVRMGTLSSAGAAGFGDTARRSPTGYVLCACQAFELFLVSH